VLTGIVRAWGTSDRRAPAVGLGASRPSRSYCGYTPPAGILTYQVDVNLAGLAVLVWTTLVPVFWKGDARG
jgi:hypothetical protein